MNLPGAGGYGVTLPSGPDSFFEDEQKTAQNEDTTLRGLMDMWNKGNAMYGRTPSGPQPAQLGQLAQQFGGGGQSAAPASGGGFIGGLGSGINQSLGTLMSLGKLLGIGA